MASLVRANRKAARAKIAGQYNSRVLNDFSGHTAHQTLEATLKAKMCLYKKMQLGMQLGTDK